jgi:hypothetical protein
MSITENDIVKFYSSCDYWPVERSPLRPRELNIPIVISHDVETIEAACKFSNGKEIVIDLDSTDCLNLAPVLLHESLFHFYRAFYNYLAAKNLCFSGMSHWANITIYYAKFYMARSVTILTGHQSYEVTRTRHNHHKSNFIEAVANTLYGAKEKGSGRYRVCLEIDISKSNGKIVFDKERISSHPDVWQDYESIEVENIGLHPLAEKDGEYRTGKYLREERNDENYSFNGYHHLYFNLPPKSFKVYFEENYTKSEANKVFDMMSGEVFLALSSQIRLYRKFNISQLPIEKEKLAFMINYCLPDSIVKERLLMLCDEGFPTRNIYSQDGDNFYDDEDRFL